MCAIIPFRSKSLLFEAFCWEISPPLHISVPRVAFAVRISLQMLIFMKGLKKFKADTISFINLFNLWRLKTVLRYGTFNNFFIRKHGISLLLKMYKSASWEFPGGPVVRTQCFQCWGLGSIPGWGIRTP